MSLTERILNDPDCCKRLLPGIRNKKLLDICALYLSLFFDERREPTLSIRKRLYKKKIFDGRFAIAEEITVEEIAQMLRVSSSTAAEYRLAFRALAFVST